jgi:hypothetical protein
MVAFFRAAGFVRGTHDADQRKQFDLVAETRFVGVNIAHRRFNLRVSGERL